MRKPHLKIRTRPEAKIQKAIMTALTLRGWYCRSTHGDAYAKGWPDVFACHIDHGLRWVEIKLPHMRGSRFTAAQRQDFPRFMANGCGIWVLTEMDGCEKILLAPPNLHEYMEV